MQLTIYNGSPRKTKANSDILLKKFLEGFCKNDETININYLAEKGKIREFVGKFQNAENIIICFPLYADGMPGLVKDFIENLDGMQLYPEKQKIGFIIHCGFPDSIHLITLERYLEKLSRRLGIGYLGTIMRSQSEGLRVTPDKLNRKLFNNLIKMGKHFRETGKFDKTLQQKIKGREKFPSSIIPILKLINKTGLWDVWWNKQLKSNNAFEQRFAKPYEMEKS